LANAVANKHIEKIRSLSVAKRCYLWLLDRGYIRRDVANSISEDNDVALMAFIKKFLEKIHKDPDEFRMNHEDIRILEFIYDGEIWIEDVENVIGVNPESLSLFTRDFCKTRKIACLSFSPEESVIAVAEPWNYALKDEITRRVNSKTHTFIGTPRKTIENILQHHWIRGAEDAEGREFIKVSEMGSISSSRSSEDSSHILVDQIIQRGISENASDIHIEPLRESGGYSVKMRVDGRLYPFPELGSPSDPIEPIVARVKILGKMRVQEVRVPQDGGFPRGSGHHAIDCRVASLPSVLGQGKEKVVMRLLRPTMEESLRTLGFEEDELDYFKDVFSCPNGIILVTGPTGSGKSTTLHCVLQEFVAKKEFSIYTVEDPVEYRLPGAHQVQVLRGVVEFPHAFRAFLRADPDIIMVGEMRDAETVHVALQAAITGHLVFSTLHTNDAPSVVPRLLAMGDANFVVEPYLIASALRGAVAQRLLETLCPHCKLERLLLPEECKVLGIPPGSKKIFDINPSGCSECRHRGVVGRTAIFEMVNFQRVPNWDSVVNENVSHEAIRKACLEGGMKTLFDSARRKLLGGTVSSRSFYNTFGMMTIRSKVEKTAGSL